jgi:hypothetical protein
LLSNFLYSTLFLHINQSGLEKHQHDRGEKKTSKTSKKKRKKKNGGRVDFYNECLVGMRKQKNKRYGVRCLLVEYVFYIEFVFFFLLQIVINMASTTSNQSQPIQVAKQTNETGFDFPLSPSEPGKFDFYR